MRQLRSVRTKHWTEKELNLLMKLCSSSFKNKWTFIANLLGTKTSSQCLYKFKSLKKKGFSPSRELTSVYDLTQDEEIIKKIRISNLFNKDKFVYLDDTGINMILNRKKQLKEERTTIRLAQKKNKCDKLEIQRKTMTSNELNKELILSEAYITKLKDLSDLIAFSLQFNQIIQENTKSVQILATLIQQCLLKDLIELLKSKMSQN